MFVSIKIPLNLFYLKRTKNGMGLVWEIDIKPLEYADGRLPKVQM